jgi:hypothetical protein
VRRTVRVFSEQGPEQRLGRAIAALPASARTALATVADREDLPLVAGSWEDGSAGCLVANVVRAMAAGEGDAHGTLDVRVLDLLPELSSRDLNRLIVAWDEAAEHEGRRTDAALCRLLRGGLAWAERHLPAESIPPPASEGAGPEPDVKGFAAGLPAAPVSAAGRRRG